MKILAIDFSSPHRGIAVLNSGDMACAADESGVRNTNALGMIEQVLRDAGLEREGIECIAVGIGPGSYTGIRAAISLAQGWQLAREVKILGISSTECIASQAPKQSISSTVNVVIDAQRNEFYVARYELQADEYHETEALRIVSLAAIQEREQANEVLIGPEVRRWFPAGKIVFPHAATLAKLAALRNDFVPGEKLEPIYLRETAFVKAAPSRIIA